MFKKLLAASFLGLLGLSSAAKADCPPATAACAHPSYSALSVFAEISVGSWTTSTRPVPSSTYPSPFGLNTTTGSPEIWNGSVWLAMAPIPGGTNGQIQINGNGAFTGLTVGTGLQVTGGALVATGLSPTGSGAGLTGITFAQLVNTPTTLMGYGIQTTGAGVAVQSNGPALIAPNLGTPSNVVLTNGTALPLGTGVVGNLSVANLSGGTNASAVTFWRGDGVWATPTGGGTVTNVAVATANGLLGSVANGSSTPLITLQTSISGMLKGSGNAIVAATPGADYVQPNGNGSQLTGLVWSQLGSTPTSVAGYGITNALVTTNNLGDLASAATARTNLGLPASATTDTTNASNITSGTLPAARLPAASAGALGGVNSIAAVTHQFLTSIGTNGVPTLAQPAAGDISGLATSATTDTTNASNITSGTLAAAHLPAPTASSLGGVQSSAGSSHQFVTGISTLGVPQLAQPAYGDLLGNPTSAQVQAGLGFSPLSPANNLSDVANASTARTNLGLGTLAVLSSLPTPSPSSLGGIQSTTGGTHQWISAIATSGVPTLSQPAFTDISGNPSSAQVTGGLGYTPLAPNGSGAALTGLTWSQVGSTPTALSGYGVPTTGTGNAVQATSPTLVTPALGTPASGVMTNVTGLPVSTGISGLGTNVATALAANLTGTGALVGASTPSIANPTLTGTSAVSAMNVSGVATLSNTLVLAATSGAGGINSSTANGGNGNIFFNFSPTSGQLLRINGTDGAGGATPVLDLSTDRTSGVNFYSTINLQPPASGSGSQHALIMNNTWSGAVTSGFNPVLFQVIDQMNGTNVGIFGVNDYIQGSASIGNRIVMGGNFALTAPSGNTTSGGNYVTGSFNALMSSNDNCVATGSPTCFTSMGHSAAGGKGSIFALNTVAQLNSGATNIAGMNSYEADVVAMAGSSVNIKQGIAITAIGGDSAQGQWIDQALAFARSNTQTAGAGWKVLIGVGNSNGFFPLDPNGTIMQLGPTQGTMLAANGLDFTLGTFSGCFLKSVGFCVSGTGGTTTAGVINTGNETISGTLGVTGTTTVAGVINTVNETIAGTLAVTGTTTVAGVINTVNETIAGTLGVTGTTTSTGLLTGSAGLTVTGGVINLNASSNNAVNIGTGSTTSTVTIGNNANTSIFGNVLTATGGNSVNIGVTGLTATLGIRGAGSSSATTAFIVQNSTTAQLMSILNDGTISLATGSTTALVSIGSGSNNVRLGSSTALATTATTGFPVIPTMAGAPSGVAPAGSQVYNSTSNVTCTSNGSTWHCI